MKGIWINKQKSLQPWLCWLEVSRLAKPRNTKHDSHECAIAWVSPGRTPVCIIVFLYIPTVEYFPLNFVLCTTPLCLLPLEEEKMEAYQRLAERSPYMRCLLKAVVPNIDELMKTRGEASSGPTSSGGQLPAPEPRVPGLQPQQEDKSPTKLSLWDAIGPSRWMVHVLMMCRLCRIASTKSLIVGGPEQRQFSKLHCRWAVAHLAWVRDRLLL